MIEVFIDGLAEPRNPGVGTYGLVAYRDGKRLLEEHGLVGEEVTNNQAEYEGLLRALTLVRPYSEEEVVIKSDSKLVVNQMSGEWKVKKGEYVAKYGEARRLREGFRSLTFVWVPREQNAEADALSRVAYSEYLAKRRGSR